MLNSEDGIVLGRRTEIVLSIHLSSFCSVSIGQRRGLWSKNGCTWQDIVIHLRMRNGVSGHAAAAEVVGRLFPARKSDRTHPRHNPQCADSLICSSLRLSSVIHPIKLIVICVLQALFPLPHTPKRPRLRNSPLLSIVLKGVRQGLTPASYTCVIHHRPPPYIVTGSSSPAARE
jgi:hypothetical protein